MPRFSEPEPLTRRHRLHGFACGEPSLDVWLTEHARRAGGERSAQPYVMHDADQGRVVGYYALTVASIEHDDATRRVARGMPRHPIPVILLARLAVDRSVQRHGIGAFLLRDAMTRTAAVAEQVGVRAMVVHALNESAKSFYARHGLEPSPTDHLHLMVLVKDIRAAIG